MRPRGLHDVEKSILDRYKVRFVTAQAGDLDPSKFTLSSGNSFGWIPNWPESGKATWCFVNPIDCSEYVRAKAHR